MNYKNPVSWFDIYVSDLDRAKLFYESVFETKLTDLPMEWGRQSLFPFSEGQPNVSGALVEKQNLIQGSNNTMVYFASEDCTTEISRVEEAGGKIIAPKMAIGEFGYIAIINDPDGNQVGIHSRQ